MISRMMSTNETSKKVLCCRIFYAGFGVAVGVSGFITWLVLFTSGKPSMHTAAFAGLSGVLAAWNLVTHIMHLQDYWRTWLKGLRWFMAFGIIFMTITTAGFVTYLILAATKNQALAVDSFYITCVWCIISLKWSALLFWYSKTYRNEFADLTALLEF